MLEAGKRPHRVRFERRIEINPDAPADLGNIESDWTLIAEVWAGFLPQAVKDRLTAGAVIGGMLGVLTALRSPDTVRVDEGCRVVFLAGPYRDQIANIRAVVPTPDSREIAFTIQTGMPV
ncbi:head-tail adaptor protein [Bosea sp. SSUT16]|uniref:Head-tail adaptor protein n=1 Tax=Bosea spartocytisi TaxID=2773451 RepID=A0A927EA56_9HYPH|nr:head-tail adaptor protein [Bosea spartocytisi]MBD3847104.1 head-tail adaptor protein [Bosea spartocytisi]MCT4474200.1 head-tail adaptor protein [Bosea spartocytisi]